jgi:hypothetical protein
MTEDRIGDVVFQLRTTIAAEGWTPGRGDYGCDHSSEMVDLIEEHNCIHGCTKSGTRAARREFGPGGTCNILALVAMGDGPIPELDPRRDGPHCTARTPPDPTTRKRRRKRGPSGTAPLFDLPEGNNK